MQTTALPPDAAANAARWQFSTVSTSDQRAMYREVAAFVAWLRASDITVPTCWYTHPWVVWRLAALQRWQDVAYADDAPPREAVDWWLIGVEPLRRDWEELLAHRGRHVVADSPSHDAQPVPPFDEVVASLPSVDAP